MSQLKLKELSKLGYTNDAARSLVINIMAKHFKHHSRPELMELLTNIQQQPKNYVTDPVLGPIAVALTGKEKETHYNTYQLLQQTGRLAIYGGKEIETGAKKQMETAMSLPVAVGGALMPDAHTGYGMPIGGVLAADNAVIPYAVGVDIGCRMALTIFDAPVSYLQQHAYRIKQALREHTHFGMEGGLDSPQQHEVLDNPLFHELDWLRKMQGKAARQLGSSGSGNHFVEFGELTINPGNGLHLPEGKYLALLSHSGSRGLGAYIAQRFMKIAVATCKLPPEAQSLAWLDMDSEAGQEYWMAMTLAGDYARACHDRIHSNLGKALGVKPLVKVENHHNFAWKEILPDGREVILHRKGATPAHPGEYGIIPGSMTTAAYLVKGHGVADALYSAAHGAGRAMSRQRAVESLTASALRNLLADAGVTLIGGSVAEHPFAYKDIEKVMDAQRELVKIEGRFLPKIVRMNKD